MRRRLVIGAILSVVFVFMGAGNAQADASVTKRTQLTLDAHTQIGKVQTMNNAANTQHAVEIVLSEIDAAIESGQSRADAITFVALAHSVDRHKLVALYNDREAGYHGNSGETHVGVVSTPSVAHGTALPEAPDFLPEDFS